MTDDLIAYIGLSEILIENLGTISIEMEGEMKRNGIYMQKVKQSHKKIRNLFNKLSSELDDSVQETNSSDFIELCDFTLQMSAFCAGISPGDRIKALSTMKLLTKQ